MADLNDFGFSGVDAPQPQVVTETQVVASEIPSDVVQTLADIEDKINVIMNNDATVQIVKEDFTDKLQKVESLVLPLLENLRDSNGDYIYWPNREDKVQVQIDRLLTITRSV